MTNGREIFDRTSLWLFFWGFAVALALYAALMWVAPGGAGSSTP
jgi:hypothetical protein